jgi:hypothetical protein
MSKPAKVASIATALTLFAWGAAAGPAPSVTTTAAQERHGSQRPGHSGHSHRRCYQPREARVVYRRGGDGPGAAFSPAFFAEKMTLEASLDEGIDPVTLQVPLAIEKVCGPPRRFADQARRLGGNDGIALVLPETSVFDHDALVPGDALIQAFEGADTATLRAQLAPAETWGADEDGNQIPTFSAKWIKITD